MAEFLHQKDFPLGSKNIIKGQFRFGTDLYIITKGEEKYKGFIINEDNPKGKKLGENRDCSVILEKIPNYK